MDLYDVLNYLITYLLYVFYYHYKFLNKRFGNREYSEDLLLLIGHSVSMHLLSSVGASTGAATCLF